MTRLAAALARGRLFSTEERDGLPTFRYLKGTRGFSQILNYYHPDAVIVHSMSAMPIAQLVSDRKIPLLVYWHDVEFHKLNGAPTSLRASHIANSQFTAARLYTEFELHSRVVNPVFWKRDPTEKVFDRNGSVLFVGPVPDKGLGIALQVARACPDIKFEFLESWVLTKESRRALSEQLDFLPNVKFTERQADMIPIYSRTRVLMVPSRWDEAWGRVITEAQEFGIPVVGARKGGIPEAVGHGGCLLQKQEGPGGWIKAIRHVYSNPDELISLHEIAKAHSQRQEVDGDANAQLIVSAMKELMRG